MAAVTDPKKVPPELYGTVKAPCLDRIAHCPTMRVIEGFWSFRYVENPGAAWGLFAWRGRPAQAQLVTSPHPLATPPPQVVEQGVAALSGTAPAAPSPLQPPKQASRQ